jgi:enamine deaminase RidA (YjgF/YER057c/UK114 family)
MSGCNDCGTPGYAATDGNVPGTKWLKQLRAKQLRPPSVVAAGRASPMEKQVPRKLISSGSSFEAQIGYSRAVVDGEWVFVSGTTGFDYATMTISEDIVAQTEQCIKNMAQALQQAGSCLEDVVRVTYVLPQAAQFEQCWPVLRKYFGEIRPAATMISAGLADPRMRIEIEVTAKKRSGSHQQEK